MIFGCLQVESELKLSENAFQTEDFSFFFYYVTPKRDIINLQITARQVELVESKLSFSVNFSSSLVKKKKLTNISR